MKKILITLLSILFLSNGYCQSEGDSLVALLKTSKEDTNRVNILNRLGWELLKKSELEKAFSYINEAKKLADNLDYKEGKALSVYLLGGYYFGKSNYQEALSFYLASLEQREEIGDKKGMSTSLNSIGLVYIILANYPEAMNNLRRALNISAELKDMQSMINATVNIGYANSELGNYPEAIKQYLAALKFCEKIKDYLGTAMCYNNMGYIYELKNEYDEALKNYNSALVMYKRINNKIGIAQTNDNMGMTYKKMGNDSKALLLVSAGLKIKELLGDEHGIADSYLNLGRIYYSNGNFKTAIENELKALFVFRKKGVKAEVAQTYLCLGEAYKAIGDFSNALNYLDSAVSLSTAIGNKEHIKNSYFQLSKLDSTLSREKGINPEKKLAFSLKALDNYQKYITYRDTMNNEENTRKTVQAVMNFEYEKKEAVAKAAQEKKDALTHAEIKRQTLLRNAILGGVGIAGTFSFMLVCTFNRKKKTSFEKKVAQVETKALRSQMDPHFIFNALNSIDDFILNNDINNSSLYINKFSRLMRLILESSRKEEVSLKEDLDSLELYIQLENLRMEKKVACKIEIAPEVNTENVLIPPMLLQPFIENAFKHAFQGIAAPKLEINIDLKDEMLLCTITDNGIGRNSEQKIKTETKEKRQSFGMTVTGERLDIISKIKKSKAYFAFEDLIDNQQKAAGTRVMLSVPASFAF